MLGWTMPSEAFARFVNFLKIDSETVSLFDTAASHTSYTLMQFNCKNKKSSAFAALCGITSRKPDATMHANSTGEPVV